MQKKNIFNKLKKNYPFTRGGSRGCATSKVEIENVIKMSLSKF